MVVQTIVPDAGCANDDIECKQVTCVLLGDSRHVYSYQNIACRTETYRKKTRLYPFCIHLCRLAHQSHQSHHLSLCCTIKQSHSNGCRGDSPCCWNRHRTVRADTEWASNISISCLMVCCVVVLFSKANVTVYLYSRALVMGGCWDPACRTVWPSATHWFFIRMKVISHFYQWDERP